MKVLLTFAAHTALRRSDCLRAAPVHYNPDKQTLTISQKKTGHLVTVPVTDELASLLNSTPEGDPATPYYVHWRGKPITNSGFANAWQVLKRKAGVNPHLWLHDLRRTLGS